MRAALLLAGGEGRRFGRRDKLLETIGGEALLLRSLRAARRGSSRTILILPPGFARRRALVARLRWPGLAVRIAADARRGLGASIRAGLAALRPIDREVAIFLADMPFAGRPALRLGGKDAVRPMRDGVPGHPLLLRVAAVRDLAMPAEGGLGALLDRHRTAATTGHDGNFLDIDTPAALRRLRYRIATRSGLRRCLPQRPVARPIR